MEFMQLRYLESVHRLKNLTKAAEEHFVSPSAISISIKKLEDELGTILINRRTRPLSLTMQGERFMLHACKILQEMEDIVDDIHFMNTQEKQVLPISWSTIFVDHLLLKICMEFPVKYPGYQLEVSENTLENMLKLLSEERIEAAYAPFSQECYSTDYQTIPCQRTSLCVVIPKGHHFEKFDCVSIDMLKHEELLSYSEKSFYERELVNIFKQQSLTPRLQTFPYPRLMVELIKKDGRIAVSAVDDNNLKTDSDFYVLRPIKESPVFLKGFILKTGKPVSSGTSKLINFTKRCIP